MCGLILAKSPPEAQLRAPLSPCKQTSFDPHLYSAASSSVGPARVESGNCKVSFILSTRAVPVDDDPLLYR